MRVSGSSVVSILNGLPSRWPLITAERRLLIGNSGFVTVVECENGGAPRSPRRESGAGGSRPSPAATSSARVGCGTGVVALGSHGCARAGCAPAVRAAAALNTAPRLAIRRDPRIGFLRRWLTGAKLFRVDEATVREGGRGVAPRRPPALVPLSTPLRAPSRRQWRRLTNRARTPKHPRWPPTQRPAPTVRPPARGLRPPRARPARAQPGVPERPRRPAQGPEPPPARAPVRSRPRAPARSPPRARPPERPPPPALAPEPSRPRAPVRSRPRAR